MLLCALLILLPMTLIGLLIAAALALLVIALCTIAARMAVVIFRSSGVKRFLFTPGIAVHELSHAFFCLITGARIKEINLFAPNGGYVKHGAPRFKLAASLISMGPLIGGPLVLLGLTWLFSMGGLSVPLNFTPSLSWSYALKLFLGIWFLFYNNIASQSPIRIALLILYIYFLISISLTISPSITDFRNSWIPLLVLFVLAAAVVYVRPLEYTGMVTGTPVLDVTVRLIMIPVAVGMGAVIITMVLLLPLYLWRRRQ